MDGINKDTNFHFIAIGGVGMSGLAKYLLEKGYSVSGSDISDGKYFQKVKELGAKVFVGHNASNLPPSSVVIASTAVKENNPELIKAKSLNLKQFHRSDLLKFIAENFQNTQGKFIGFSGTHGKTTTSGMAAFVMQKANLNPDFVVGGIVPELDTNAQASTGKYFAAELDESDGTILKYTPDITVINNIEVDHVDFYKNGMDSLLATFTTFIKNLKPTSKILINNDCEGNKKLIAMNRDKKFITYGFNNADYTANNISFKNGKTSFEIVNINKILCKINLSVHGNHNICNAMAVAVALHEAGIKIDTIAKYFEDFTGMGRRYQPVATVKGTSIIDDYAHHPSEIKATLECAKNCNPNKQIVAIFQPHRYTRLHGLYSEFLGCFDNADKILVLDTFAASEEPIGRHTSEEFANDLQKKSQKTVLYIPGKIADIPEDIAKHIDSECVAITLGAGDITKLGPAVADILRKKV